MTDVSVVMITYFAEKYVAEAIESVLKQKTKYTYEIVISDDCSGDRTQEIIKSYREKYPDIIKVFINEKNVGLSMNNYKARCHCKGRYLAVLDGDDYWIDDNKMEWQVDFLENNPEYYAVACSVQGRYDDLQKPFAVYPENRYRDKRITLNDYLNGAIFGTNGMTMRNAYLSEEGRNLFTMVPKASPYIDDTTECILVLQCGDVYISSRESTVYRVPQYVKGKHNFNSINDTKTKTIKKIKLLNYLYNNLNPRPDLYYIYKVNLSVAYADCIRRFKLADIGRFNRMIPEEYLTRKIKKESMFGMIGTIYKTLKRKLFTQARR